MTVVDVIALGLGHWLTHVLGTDSGPWYAFWSGVGADLGGLAIVGTSLGLYRRHKCHVHRCWRLAKQQVDGTSWIVCHHHHPHGKPTAEQLDALREDR